MMSIRQPTIALLATSNDTRRKYQRRLAGLDFIVNVLDPGDPALDGAFDADLLIVEDVLAHVQRQRLLRGREKNRSSYYPIVVATAAADSLAHGAAQSAVAPSQTGRASRRVRV